MKMNVLGEAIVQCFIMAAASAEIRFSRSLGMRIDRILIIAAIGLILQQFLYQFIFDAFLIRKIVHTVKS